MLNIDTRILKDLTGDQYWLLSHILNYAGSDMTCYPSNKTLCEDTQWEIKKLQRVKQELMDLGLLIATVRRNDAGKQTSNEYKIQTDLITVYIPAKKLRVTLDDDTPPKNGYPIPETDTTPTLFADTTTPPKKGQRSINQKEVLTNEEKALLPFRVMEYFNLIKKRSGMPGSCGLDKVREKAILAWEKKGYKFEDFKRVINLKFHEWCNNPEMQKHLRTPETMLRPKNFPRYVEEAASQPAADWTDRETATVDSFNLGGLNEQGF